MLGLGVVSIAGCALNFFLPLSPPVSAAIWLGGILVFRRRARWIFEGLTRGEVIGAFGVLAACVLLMQPPLNYDSGLYYLQAIKWAAEQRLEIGLVNLHSRLGFNSPWLVLGAALQHPLAPDESAFFLNLLPLTFAGAAAGASWSSRRFPDVAAAMLLVPIAAATEGLGAPSADYALAIIVSFALVLFARSLENESGPDAFAAALLSLFAVLVKLSAAPLAVGAVAIVVARRNRIETRKLAIIAAVAVAIWLARSLLLSGCLAYPVSLTCIEALPWTPTRPEVRGLASWIYSWSRMPNARPEEVLGTWAWLPSWAGRVFARGDYRLLFGLLAAGAAAWLALARSTAQSLTATTGIAWAGVAFWFFSAPDPRFGLGFLLAAALLPLAFALSAVSARGVAPTVIAVVAISFVAVNGVIGTALRHGWPIPALTWPALPIARTERKVTLSGYEVEVPLDGSQCWASPIPCTPYFNPRLRRDGALLTR
jgi:hypothetical protein